MTVHNGLTAEVLGLLRFQAPLSVDELVSLTGTGKGQVQRCIKHLVATNRVSGYSATGMPRQYVLTGSGAHEPEARESATQQTAIRPEGHEENLLVLRRLEDILSPDIAAVLARVRVQLEATL